MTDPRDRLLEYALQELLQEKEEPDLAALVAARYAHGETGSDLPPELLAEVEAQAQSTNDRPSETRPRNGHALPTPAPPAPSETPARLRRVTPWVGAGGLVAAALLFIVFGPGGPGGPGGIGPGETTPGTTSETTGVPVAQGSPPIAQPPIPTIAVLAQSTTPLESWRAGSEPLERTRFTAGDVLVVRNVPAAIELGSTRLEVGSGSVLALGGTATEPKIELRRGRMSSSTGALALAIGTPASQVRLAPSSAVSLTAVPEGDFALATIEFFVHATDPLPFHVTVEVGAGEAVLDNGAGSVELATGERRSLAVERYDDEWLSFDEDVRLAKLADDCFYMWFKSPAPPAFQDEPWMWAMMDALASFLDGHERRWIAFENWADEALAPEGRIAPPGLARAVAQFLVLQKSERSLQAARAFWLERPGAFSIDLQVTLAERGAFEMERELLAYLEAPDLLALQELVTVAGWALLREEEAGIREMRALFASDLLYELRPINFAIVCSALERIGDREAAEVGREGLRREVTQALDLGDLPRARVLVLQADFIKRLFGENDASLARIGVELRSFVEERLESLEDEAAVRRLLDSI